MTAWLGPVLRGRVLRPPLVDAVVAVVLAVVGLLETGVGGLWWVDRMFGDPLVNAMVVTACTLALAWRTAAPTLVLCVVLSGFAGLALAYGASQTTVGVFAAGVAIYSAAAHGASLTLSGVVVALGVAVRDFHDAALVTVGDHVWSPLFATLAFGGGVAARLHQGRARAVERQNEVLQRDQAALVAAVVEDERSSIARELHDIVSHSLGVVVLQAGAAESVLDDPERVRGILRSIRASGLEAIGEMGTLLDVLRADPEPARHPQPTLADLSALIANAQPSEGEVVLSIEGEARPLPAALELSAYRIAQEGLTNALKHSSARHIAVTLRYTSAGVEVEVVDDGSGTDRAPGARRGLAGIGERVKLFGGELIFGPRPAGGWSMLARLPAVR